MSTSGSDARDDDTKATDKPESTQKPLPATGKERLQGTKRKGTDSDHSAGAASSARQSSKKSLRKATATARSGAANEQSAKRRKDLIAQRAKKTTMSKPKQQAMIPTADSFHPMPSYDSNATEEQEWMTQLRIDQMQHVVDRAPERDREVAQAWFGE